MIKNGFPKKKLYAVRTNVLIRCKNKGGKLLAKVSGCSTSWDIIPRTISKSDLVRKDIYPTGYCTDISVVITDYDYTKDCDDNVRLLDYTKNESYFDRLKRKYGGEQGY